MRLPTSDDTGERKSPVSRTSIQLPDGMTVKYSTNRSSVVSVKSGGTALRTSHSGVATVTATVSYHGKTATGTFVVDVQ